jgi:hypothetical protein
MRHISLIALYVGLNNLLVKRATVLAQFPSGPASIAPLTSRRDAMAKLPAVAAGRAFANELGTADDIHDALGQAIWHFTEAYLRHPNTPANIIAAAQRIRAAFVPTLEDLGASYAAEAKGAIDKAPSLQELKNDLELLPVAGGQTLYQWAESFIAAGTKIDDLLAARADTEQKNRKAAATLRVEVIGILNRLRKNLALESKDDPALPRDLESQVFGYLDLLEKTCADARAKGTEVEDLPPPPDGSSSANP